MKKILVLSNSIDGLYSFRKEIFEKLIDRHDEITICAPESKRTDYFIQLGCRYMNIPMNRRGVNLFEDALLLSKYIRTIKRVKPDLVLTYTIKPNVYGGIACRVLKTKYISNITGLGNAVQNGGILRKISLYLYRMGIKRASCVFFQNTSNRDLFEKEKIVNGRTRIIPGSGVNLKQHAYEEYPAESNMIRFLFIGRISRDKGIDELLEAVQAIKNEYPNTAFAFFGNMDSEYESKINDLIMQGTIEYFGYINDVHPYIKDSHATLLPSYHEGMANVLLETASAGRPVLASRIPGCMETFDEGISGYGFEARNADDLIHTVRKFIALPHDEKRKMGREGRRKMEREFDRNIIIEAYLDEIKWICN